MGARDAAVAPTPKEVIWRKNKARLYRYTPRSEKATKRRRFCAPLINRAYILICAPVRASLHTFVAGSMMSVARLGEWNE